MASVAYVSHPDYELHVQGPMHPERPERVTAINSHLETTDLWSRLHPVTPEPAPIETIESVHDPAYVEALAETCERSGGGLLVDGRETGIVPKSFNVARLAVGAATASVDSVMNGNASRAFSAVRPPGHHAVRGGAMGFCLFNNVAIGARYAQRQYGIERIAIVDWDFHHGNGTQEAFWRDPDVLFCSAHYSPAAPMAYPGTGYWHERGEGKGEGLTVNLPLPPHTSGPEYVRAFDEALVPAIESFQPEMIFISAGFDAHRDDPLSRMFLDEADFGKLTERVDVLADRFADGRVVSVLEGGYNAAATARSVEHHIRALIG